MTEQGPDPSNASEESVGKSTAFLPVPNRGEPELIVAATPDEVARLAADRIATALVAAVGRRRRADFCTTGGRTSMAIYRLLAQPSLSDLIPWPAVHVWWGDDRFVPRGHPESNVTALDDVLLGGGAVGQAAGRPSRGAPLPMSNIHPFPTDRAMAERRDNSWCAARYADEMRANLPLIDGNWPAFDLILVGVGDDGHVLSCFPDSMALASMAWAIGVPAPTHIGPRLPRMTLNPRLLEAAPILVVTWGASKAEALDHVFGETRDDRRWPVQRTRRTGATWIVDEAAAAQIPTRRRR